MGRRIKFVLIAVVGCCLWPALSGADTLDVPLIGQEKSLWCWNASCEMVLEYYGHANTQTAIADWAVGGQNTVNGLDVNGVGPILRLGLPPWYFKYGCKQVLANETFGPVNSTYLARSLTSDEIETEIDNERPAILGVVWKKNGQTAGGHAIVLCGYEAGDMVSLNDPWPRGDSPAPGNPGVAYLVARDSLFNAESRYTGSALSGNQWAETLKTGRALDVCFLIDATGSMWDDISAVKAAAQNLTDELTSNYGDLRIAVASYRDYPDYPYGNYDDYITRTHTAFTDDAAAAKSGINAITASGGADWSEAVFSALIGTMSGSGVGAWRDEAERRIILMGDAPGHDPEPWAGGNSYADVTACWGALAEKIAVHALCVGGDTDAESQFQALATSTGGSTVYADAAGSVVGAMADLIEDFTETPRFPRDIAMAVRPMFRFDPPTESMGPPIKKVLLEIQGWNARTSAWRNYKKITLAPAATSWTPPRPLPQGQYRWRVGYTRPTGALMLPSGEPLRLKGVSLMEEAWTEFTRARVEPADPVQLSPSSAFTADNRLVTYRFGAALNADQYAIEIYKVGSGWELKRWKRMTVKPPKNDPTAAVLEVKVNGHVVGVDYVWAIQSLNYDRPKPVDDGWVMDW